MTRRLISFVQATLVAIALTGFLVPIAPVSTTVSAQATINSTTLGAAVTATAQSITVASAATIAAGQLIFVDRELMQVQTSYVSGTSIPVTRGVNGTRAYTHASGSQVWTGPANYFSQSEPAGNCLSTAEVALPRIVGQTGNVYQCSNSIWVRYADGGVHEFSAGSVQSYATSTAITVQPGLSLLGSGGALSMTLAAPSAQQDGLVMNIFASTAQAHTITNTAGFNGGTTARDVCTLGGAIGDGITIVAFGGVWYVTANRNCTLA